MGGVLDRASAPGHSLRRNVAGGILGRRQVVTGPDPLTTDKPTARPLRRLVLYAHGFDPRGPAPYHAMNKADAAREQDRIGLAVGARRTRRGETGWTLEAHWPDGDAAVDFVVLRWDDLVRDRWDKDLWPQFRALLRWCLAYVRKGLFAEASRSARPLFWAMIAPPATAGLYMLAIVLTALVTTVLLSWIATALGAPAWIGLLGLVILAIGPLGWKRVDAQVNICWLSRCFGYLAELGEDAPKNTTPGSTSSPPG